MAIKQLKEIVFPGSDDIYQIIVDAELSETSENPVQNKVIKEELNTMQKSIDEFFDNASITVDTELSETSENPVQNKVINAALTSMQNSIDEFFDNASITVDSALSSTSENPVQNKVINAALTSMQASIDKLFDSASPKFDYVAFHFTCTYPDGTTKEWLSLSDGNTIVDDFYSVNTEVTIGWRLTSVDYKATGANKCDSTLTLKLNVDDDEDILASDLEMKTEDVIDDVRYIQYNVDRIRDLTYTLSGIDGDGRPFSSGVKITFGYPYYYGALSKDTTLDVDDFETLIRRYKVPAAGDTVGVNVTETDNYIWVLSTEDLTGVKCNGFQSKFLKLGSLYNANGVKFNCYRAQYALQAGNYDISFY